MYKVKVIYQPVDTGGQSRYKKQTIEGIYIPKEDRTKSEKITEQVKQFVTSNLCNKEEYPSVILNILDVQITRISYKFICKEDSL